MNNPKYVLKSTVNSQYRWVLHAVNGEPILTSETYTRKEMALKGIASSKLNVADSHFERRVSVSYQPYFVQKAGNGEILGTSEMYSSTSARDNGIRAVQRDAPNANVEDLT